MLIFLLGNMLKEFLSKTRLKLKKNGHYKSHKAIGLYFYFIFSVIKIFKDIQRLSERLE